MEIDNSMVTSVITDLIADQDEVSYSEFRILNSEFRRIPRFGKKSCMAKNYILDQSTASRKLERIAYEIVENNLDEQNIILVGIRDNGSIIAQNIHQLLQQISNIKCELIHLSLDKRSPGEIQLSKEIDYNNRVIIVIDDVANSGRTMLYALKPFLAFHPKKIQTLVMVERTHKAFPVNSDYVGLSVATTLQEHIYVEVHGSVVTGAWME